MEKFQNVKIKTGPGLSRNEVNKTAQSYGVKMKMNQTDISIGFEEEKDLEA